jgi:phosphonate transport system ATP-binding protein
MILGPSGSGKSTLLKAFKGLLVPQSGTISLFGIAVSGRSDVHAHRAQQQRVAWIPQSLGLVRNATVLDNVLSGALGRVGTVRSLAKMFPASIRQEALSILDSLGLASKADEKVFNLSGGERQRVAIGRSLMQRPRVVLADEFVSHLDPVTAREIMSIVTTIARAGVAFLITSHKVELVAERPAPSRSTR